MSGGRLTRKEMVQEDQIHFTMNRILEFVLDNAKALAGILGAFVLLILGIYFFMDYRSGNRQEIQASLGQAMEKFQAEVGESSSDNSVALLSKRYKTETEKYNDALSAFSAVAVKAQGTALYPIARYHEGLCMLELGKKSEFQSVMEQLIQSKENADIASLATLAVAENYLADGVAEKATEYYEKILQDNQNNLPKDTILTTLAEYHTSQNEKEKAISFWKRLLKDFPNSSSKSKAESALTKFGEKIS